MSLAAELRRLDDLPPEILDNLTVRSEPDFDCAICGQHIDCSWNPRGASWSIPPICNVCERVSGYDWAGRPRYRTKPTGGSHMDRRNATRILALADEIQAEAQRQHWSNRHGKA